MNYHKFKETLKTELQSRINEKESVSLKTLKKNNGKIKDCISIEEKGVNLIPQIHIQELYEDYCETQDIDKIVEKVLELARTKKFVKYEQIFPSWNQIKEQIECKLISYKLNEEWLVDVPYKKFLDLALVFQIRLQNSESGVASTPVTYSILQTLGITAEELMQVGWEQLQKERYVVKDIEEIIMEFLGFDVKDQECSGKEFVMTNEEKFYGAAGMLRIDEMKVFAEKVDDNFYILPSSIHELILVPNNIGLNSEELRSMVKKVNSEKVELEDRLSDSLYYFDREKEEVILIEESVSSKKK